MVAISFPEHWFMGVGGGGGGGEYCCMRPIECCSHGPTMGLGG